MILQKNSIKTFILALGLGSLTFIGCEENEDLLQSVLAQPITPEKLEVTDITGSSLKVKWAPFLEEEGVKNYLVYQNNIQVALDTLPEYQATGLEPESSYTYSVRAINYSDKISDFSPEVTVLTKSADVTIPNPDPETEPEIDPETEADKILVFSKTAAFRHTSIEKGLATFVALGAKNDFEVELTEDASDFNSENLSDFKAVVFLSTTGDVLNADQQRAFEKYIQGGGSYMGVHAATDCEYEWPWYGQLVGAYFNGHPDIQEATINVLDTDHQATQHLETTWTRTDEWYNFRDINDDIDVLMTLDESSYTGGTNGENHPISWYHQFEGGRSFYTAGGHSDAAFDEPDFQTHLLGGILYCLKR